MKNNVHPKGFFSHFEEGASRQIETSLGKNSTNIENFTEKLLNGPVNVFFLYVCVILTLF